MSTGLLHISGREESRGFRYHAGPLTAMWDRFGGWFRFFGYGLHWTDHARTRPLFSERYSGTHGIPKRVYVHIGTWCFGLLRRGAAMSRLAIVRIDADGTVIDGTAEMTSGFVSDFRDLDGNELVLPGGSRFEIPLDDGHWMTPGEMEV